MNVENAFNNNSIEQVTQIFPHVENGKLSNLRHTD